MLVAVNGEYSRLCLEKEEDERCMSITSVNFKRESRCSRKSVTMCNSNGYDTVTKTMMATVSTHRQVSHRTED